MHCDVQQRPGLGPPDARSSRPQEEDKTSTGVAMGPCNMGGQLPQPWTQSREKRGLGASKGYRRVCDAPGPSAAQAPQSQKE